MHFHHLSMLKYVKLIASHVINADVYIASYMVRLQNKIPWLDLLSSKALTVAGLSTPYTCIRLSKIEKIGQIILKDVHV